MKAFRSFASARFLLIVILRGDCGFVTVSAKGQANPADMGANPPRKTCQGSRAVERDMAQNDPGRVSLPCPPKGTNRRP